MATIDKVKKIRQLSYGKMMLEGAKNNPCVNRVLREICASGWLMSWMRKRADEGGKEAKNNVFLPVYR